jgi:hypothetical protein
MGVNQDGPPGAGGPPVANGLDVHVESELPAAAEAGRPAEETARAAAVEAAAQAAERARAGLLRWGALTLAGVALGALLGRADAAPFLALAALFALAASWDARDRARSGDPAADALLDPGEGGRALRALAGAVPGVLGGACFAGLAAFAAGLPASPAHALASAWSAVSALACLVLALPRAADLAARVLLPFAPRSHVARITAALGTIVLLLPVPVWAVFDELGGWLGESGKPLLEVGGLLSQLAGELAIALGAVGLWVARGARATRERLGLGGMGGREWAIAALGLGVVTGLNGGLEWVERTWFPELWRADQAMSERIVGDITVATSLVLGLSAGVGEEVLVRGALQPRTGLVWASLLFGAAHVQYTWFGMLVIVLLGVTLGLVRRHANTTTAIVVHAAYDIVAVLSARG